MTTFETQDTDVFHDADPGIAFTVDNQSWTVSAGVLVSSGRSAGITSGFDGSTLVNDGAIVSASEGRDAVELAGNNSALLNAVGARIIGAFTGMNLDGDGATVTNHGSISGLAGDGIELDFNAQRVSLTNDGMIYGRDIAIINSSDFPGSVIQNFGLITSPHVGIVANTETGIATVVTNAEGATIHGDEFAIFAEAGRVSLVNAGTIAGEIDLVFQQAEDDRIVNHGQIVGATLLGAGNDVFIGTGGTSGEVDGEDGNDQLAGGAKADRFFGDGGKDRLIGAAGNDQLNGGWGFDTLTGGTGSDRFIFDNTQTADRVTDFNPGIDKIVLDLTNLGPNGILAASHFHVGTAAADHGDRIIFDPANGFVFYDGDGKGGAGEVHFATLAPHLALHNTDFVVQFLIVE